MKTDCNALNSSFVIVMGFKYFWHDLHMPLKKDSVMLSSSGRNYKAYFA
jgi:hypothetical protein